MVWVNSIYQLQYYNQIAGVPCYCEQVIYPNDLQLQALIGTGSGSYTVHFYVYSADGLTKYEDATAYFNWYAAVQNNSTQRYIGARLNSYSTAMCAHNCFIIRLTVQQNGNTLFDAYTQRYCVPSCCDTARGVTFSQDLVIGGGTSQGGGNSPLNGAPSGPSPVSDCGYPIIRLISTFDCIDLFGSDYYGTPTVVLQGTANFPLTKISTFQGRIVARPRDITRDISYNCILQRSESARQYFLEAYEYFPSWKMVEIENQLHANHIYIDDFTTYKEYEYIGGTPFKKVSGANSCQEVFKLETAFQDCIVRQTFGCGDPCTTVANYFIIPPSYQGGPFFSEAGELIATTFDGSMSSPYQVGLLDWLRNQDGITDVEDIDVSGFDCDIYALVKVEGTGYIPTSFYYSSVSSRNRVFSLSLSDTTNICGYTGGNACTIPDYGDVLISDFVCGAPDNGTVIISDVTPTDLTINNYSVWVLDSGATSATLLSGQVKMDISTTNSATVVGVAGETYTFSNETIATISAAGRPAAQQTLNSTNTGALSAGQIIQINPDGTIVFSGSIILSVDNEATLTFTNLLYNIS